MNRLTRIGIALLLLTAGSAALAQIPPRASPAGQLVQQLGSRTEFDSPRSYSVARRRGPWLGVVTPLRPNGHLG
jgi:hypothetical protein